MKKMIVSLPDHQVEAIDRIRAWQRVPRSRVIQHALDLYLTSPRMVEEAERAYEAGYRAIPEDPADAEAYARAAAEVLGEEDWT